MQAGAMDDILGAYERELADKEKATGDSSELGKQQFLELLTTQLEHQDPLDPMDDKKFVAQLAQFSSLEQLTNISGGIDSLNKNSDQEEMLGAVNYIGKQVLAEGDSIYKEGDQVSSVYFSLDEQAANTYANVLDKNGNIIQSVNLGSFQPGDYTYTWDGKNFNGNEASNGEYKVTFSATDSKDKSVMVDKQVAGEVVGLERNDGVASLVLSGGRTIEFSRVKEVVGDSTSEDSEESSG
ncbi:MAG: flagellar hook assembly protein FlgD [Desulfonatronovibrionaceae bacterium]